MRLFDAANGNECFTVGSRIVQGGLNLTHIWHEDPPDGVGSPMERRTPHAFVVDVHTGEAFEIEQDAFEIEVSLVETGAFPFRFEWRDEPRVSENFADGARRMKQHLHIVNVLASGDMVDTRLDYHRWRLL